MGKKTKTVAPRAMPTEAEILAVLTRVATNTDDIDELEPEAVFRCVAAALVILLGRSRAPGQS